MSPRTAAEKQKLIKSASHNTTLWESDCDPILRCLEQEYRDIDAPALQVAFFDIETSFNKEFGWSDPGDATNYITSISIYLQWLDEMICLAIPPDTLTWDQAQGIADKVGNVILFEHEKDMLNTFMDLVQDADVLSGWNSEAYDIPYTINRIKKVVGKQDAGRLCLWDQQPKDRKFERGGKEQPTYDLVGRIHMDYMQLYKKYNYEERHSYALNAIAEAELGDRKVDYDGTLDELYNDDFEKFLQYNIQDTRLLDRLDKKLQFIYLANSIAHANCVPIPTVMGAVAVTDQAVVMEAHSRNMVVMNKKRGKSEEESRAAGGWVATPRKGMHKWIGSTDMKSLYPSVIRAFNMSNETIVGQIQQVETDAAILSHTNKGAKYTFANWWNDRFNILELNHFFENDIAVKLSLDMEDGNSYQITGAELRELVFDKDRKWCISANGTIFRTDIDGLIPGLLTRWYNERKVLQGILTQFEEINAGIPTSVVLSTTNTNTGSLTLQKIRSYRKKLLDEILQTNDEAEIIKFLSEFGLIIANGVIAADDAHRKLWKQAESYWDKQQLVKKISLNSAYGALLNAGSRFFDQRLGQSTTLSGRSITKHMAAKTNEYITGTYDHYGEAIIYGDTDSCYFSAWPVVKKDVQSGEIVWTKESVIELYNEVARHVSSTFPDFLKEKFNVPVEKSKGVIASSRETVAESGLYIVKKRYAILMYDKDGFRQDTNGKIGKVKAMGLDLKRADTPKFVQEFLSEILLDTLTDKGQEYVLNKIKDFKEKFEAMKPWQKGTPRAVNRISYYQNKEEEYMAIKASGRKPPSLTVPGHVRASINWNRLREINGDQHAPRIMDGQKIVVCKLKDTSNNWLTSVAFPVDATHLPDWFTSLPFDEDDMMAGIVDQKVKNLLGVLSWNLDRTQKSHLHLESLFDFGALD